MLYSELYNEHIPVNKLSLGAPVALSPKFAPRTIINYCKNHLNFILI